MRLVFLGFAVLLLTACSRPLAPGERALAEDIFGGGLASDQVRIAAGFGVVPAPAPRPLPPKSDTIEPRPGVCDRVAPAGPDGPPPAWAIYQTVHVARAFYRDDVMPGWPDQVLLPQVLILAHELVHVWQWQNRRLTGYRPLRAGVESLFNLDPYFYVPEPGAGFLEYGFEQQAALVEDYICYGVFDPENPRRAELRKILEPHFRVARIDEILRR